MYYIYHIPNFIWSDGSKGKIGCTNNPLKRVKSQGYTNYEILEIHSDIHTASMRETELQKEYGYKKDKQLYSQTISIRCGSDKLKEINRKRGLDAVKSGRWSEISLKSIKIISKPILCFDYKTQKFIQEFESISEAARKLNLKSVGNISQVLNKKRNHTGGYMFLYKN